MRTARALVAGAGFVVLAGCATPPLLPTDAKFASADNFVRAARNPSAPAGLRIANYLAAAAAVSVTPPGPGIPSDDARTIYNIACAELTVLLRSAENGRFWNRPLSVSVGGGGYRLNFAARSRATTWPANEFTSFIPASDVSLKHVTTANRREGFGGTLVGARKLNPREPFSSKAGIAAAVTSTLDFRGRDVTLTLRNPVREATARINGVSRPTAANFSAPLCFYPEGDPTLTGILGGLRPALFSKETGLYLVQPFDPNRIPIVFVHGLISTPYIWVDVINKLQMDPVLREKYQCIVYAYPTGNPIAYASLEFRQWLAKFEKAHQMPRGYLLISHSLGGLLAQMQVTMLGRSTWERAEGDLARQVLAKMKPGGLVEQMLLFRPNPKIKRVIFISTPHRGADMAVGRLAEFAERLITLPGTVALDISQTMGGAIRAYTGGSDVLPDGVNGLAPGNPLLITMATRRVVPPCHSIIGNRGLPGPLAQSSDGIVPYWSSHLSYSNSEVIVPGPHSCYDYPESIAELKRILHVHLASLRSE